MLTAGPPPSCSSRRLGALVERCTEVGGLHLGAVADLVGRALGEELPEVEDRDAVGEVEHELHVVLHEHERGAPLLARTRRSASPSCSVSCTSSPDDGSSSSITVGSDGERPGDLDQPAGAERDRHRRSVGDRLEPEQREDLLDRLVLARTGPLAEAGEVAGEAEQALRVLR